MDAFFQQLEARMNSTQNGMQARERSMPECEEGEDGSHSHSRVSFSSAKEQAEYESGKTGYSTYVTEAPFHLKYSRAVLPEVQVAYETWGELNADRSNAVLVQAGLIGHSHAKSHPEDTRPGWWEKLLGPGGAVDTSKFFVICSSHLGGCHGTTGPSSINPANGKRYATDFPIVSLEDMAYVDLLLLDHLGIDRLHAAVGGSMGGMLSMSLVTICPERVGRVAAISTCARTTPYLIGACYLQRQCVMNDPNWNGGHYYDGEFPSIGLKQAREISCLAFRSAEEWGQRFGRKRIHHGDPSLDRIFVLEQYLNYLGNSFSSRFDPNALLYILKAVELFDLSEGFGSLEEALSRVRCPVLVMGAKTDLIFPLWQQKELAEGLRGSGNDKVSFFELDSVVGHDTFLVDIVNVGMAIKGFLETDPAEYGGL